MPASFKHLDTRIIHAGEPEPRIHGAVSLPIFQSATYAYTGQGSYTTLRYIRMNNSPNHLALHQKLAALENGESALVAASGMAAITTALFALLRPGDHILAQNCLYGGTHDVITRDFAELGFSCDFIDGSAPDTWAAKLRPATRLLYCETLTNPLLQVADLSAMAEFARTHGLVSMIDNTFATPVNFRPLDRGFDLSLHSATKYLNGHSDILAGAVVGAQNLVKKVADKLVHLGGTLDPHACFLLHRGIKTLAVRVRHQNQSALALARFLEAHPAVGRVNYPGLESHPDHRRAAELFDGFGGMLSFEPQGGLPASRRFMDKVTLAIVAPSLGGVETLVTLPATTSHAGMAPEERRALGISDSLIRVSVGLEAPEDLTADFDAALKE